MSAKPTSFTSFKPGQGFKACLSPTGGHCSSRPSSILSLPSPPTPTLTPIIHPITAHPHPYIPVPVRVPTSPPISRSTPSFLTPISNSNSPLQIPHTAHPAPTPLLPLRLQPHHPPNPSPTSSSSPSRCIGGLTGHRHRHSRRLTQPQRVHADP